MSHLFNKKLGFWKRSKFIHTLLFIFFICFYFLSATLCEARGIYNGCCYQATIT